MNDQDDPHNWPPLPDETADTLRHFTPDQFRALRTPGPIVLVRQDSKPRRIMSAIAGIFLAVVLALTFVGTFIR